MLDSVILAVVSAFRFFVLSAIKNNSTEEPGLAVDICLLMLMAFLRWQLVHWVTLCVNWVREYCLRLYQSWSEAWIVTKVMRGKEFVLDSARSSPQPAKNR